MQKEDEDVMNVGQSLEERLRLEEQVLESHTNVHITSISS